MEELELNLIEKKIFDLLYNELSISDFEEWVYGTTELETFLASEDYMLLISLNYKSRHAKAEAIKILDIYINYGKFENIKVTNLLNKALNRDKNIGDILIQFYYMYCDGYYFFNDLGLGYGLACEVPQKYGDSWVELSEKQKSDIINSFYPQIESDIKRALDWIKNKKIILTGTKNEMDRWEFIDYRTPEEKKSTVWLEVDSKKGAKRSRHENKKRKKWWGFWR